MKIQPIGRGKIQIGSRYEIPDNPLTASEALYGFGGWLTSRDEPITMSGHHNAGIVADLIDIFCKTNKLEEPRDNWARNLTHPKAIIPNGHRRS
ncbi:hypothetical protein LCGC14_1080620 [marine sediment metagenome]|uniref:Uncharacterized protein n=1 Tax=marine sediment metagenome TaxID=412755 RepID=A0A0F9QL69_9ZZZZ